MMRKMIYGAVVLLLIQVGHTVVMHSGDTGLEVATADTAFFEFNDVDDITAIQIADNEGDTLTLVKDDSGWGMQEASGAPADENQLISLLDKLASARAGLAVATSAGSAKRFKTEADDFERHVLLREGEKTIADFYLGTSAGFRHSHVRKAGDDSVFSLPVSNFEFSAKASGWLDKTLARVDREKLKRIAYDDILLVRENDDWVLSTPLTGEGDPEQIEALLDALTGLTVRDVYAAGEVSSLFTNGADIRYKLTFSDDSEKNMELAEYDDAYVLKMSGSDLFFKVESWQVEKISDFDLAKLIKRKSETTDAGTSKAQE